MLDEEDLKILRHIDEKVVVYPHEVAEQMWPDDPNRNLRIGSHLKTLTSGGYVVRRGSKQSYIVSTPKGEQAVKDAARAAVKPLFDEGDSDVR